MTELLSRDLDNRASLLWAKGYRVVLHPEDDGFCVGYPTTRPTAMCKRYSHESFPSKALAWEFAWSDYLTVSST